MMGIFLLLGEKINVHVRLKEEVNNVAMITQTVNIDSLQLFHSYLQRVCLPLQLHHHRGTHTDGTESETDEQLVLSYSHPPRAEDLHHTTNDPEQNI